MLDIAGLSKSFGAHRALDGVDLRIPEGEVLAVLGPSGCGKTTLLRLVAGLEELDAGRILWRERDLRLGDSALVFQDAPLYPHLTVAQNVRFPLRLRAGRRTPEPAERVAQVLDLLRIGHLAARRPHELSGGQRQRVGIARALVRNVPVHLFDEPLAHLDEALAQEILADLRGVRAARGLTGLYVTHSRREAFALGDAVAVMSEGAVEQVGSAREIWEEPASAFVARFVGGRAMNLVPEENQLLGFRPEHARLAPPNGAHRSSEGLRIPARVLDAVYAGERRELVLGTTGTREATLRVDLPGTFGTVAAPEGAVEGSLWTPQAGADVVVAVPAACVHRFDARTERRLRS